MIAHVVSYQYGSHEESGSSVIGVTLNPKAIQSMVDEHKELIKIGNKQILDYMRWEDDQRSVDVETPMELMDGQGKSSDYYYYESHGYHIEQFKVVIYGE